MIKLLLVVALLIMICKSCPAQQQLCSIHAFNQVLDSVFIVLGNQDAHYVFFRKYDDVSNTFIDLNIDKQPIPVILEKVFCDIPFTCEIKPQSDGGGFCVNIYKDLKRPFVGTILDQHHVPKENITVRVKGTEMRVMTDEQGLFHFKHLADDAILQISGQNIYSVAIPIRGHCRMEITVKFIPTALTEATVTNGKSDLPADKLALFIKSTKPDWTYNFASADAQDHISRYSPGLLQSTPKGSSYGLTFGGWNTLFFQHDPVIVWDKFDYPGRISDMNPYDVPNITFLNDVASENIWETRSANGVIVFSSKSGHYRQAAEWNITMNTTVAEKPELSALRWMSPQDYIDFERQTYASGYYNNVFYSPTFAVTPALSILRKMDSGSIDRHTGAQLLNKLGSYNVVDDLKKYYYHPAFVQQIHVSVNGGSATQKYYASLGYDYSPTSLVRNSYERLTVHANYTAHPFSQKFESVVLFNATSIETHDNNTGLSPVPYTYAQMMQSNGKPATLSYLYNPDYIDTAGQGKLYDWTFQPLKELALADQQTDRYVAHLQLGLTWKPAKGLSLAAYSQLFRGWTFNKTLYDKHSFYVRDLVNQFAQINGSNVNWPVPYGNIMSSIDSTFKAYNFRTEVKYKHIGDLCQWAGYAGFEASDKSVTGISHQTYDYGQGSPLPVDYASFFPTQTNGLQQISRADDLFSTDERYVSAFANAYVIFDRLSLYASGRMDASNFMNVPNNSRWTPFWAGGVSYRLSDTGMYAAKYHLKAALGCNGNISNRQSWLTVQSLRTNIYNNPQIAITNPPDFAPQWEKVYRLDAGFDFAILRDAHEEQGHLRGSVDIYYKIANHLLGYDSLPLSAGYSAMMRSDAGIRGQGINLQLTGVCGTDKLKWENSFLLTLFKDRVSRYGFMAISPESFVTGGYPMKGYSPAALFSYRNASLDPKNGDPRGLLKGQLSKDYNALITDSSVRVQNDGSAIPTIYGSYWNTFSWHSWQLSIGIGFKAGYHIRRPSINYSDLLLQRSSGDKDYERRWIKPGDESTTFIPSLVSAVNTNRDAFFLNSQSLSMDGSFVRLQDCRLSYTIVQKDKKKAFFKDAIISTGVTNLMILWKANKEHIDPDVVGGLPVPRAWTLGCRLSL